MSPRFLWRWWRARWRAGQFTPLWLTLVLATVAISTSAFFTGAVQEGLRRHGAELLGADAVVSRNQPLPPAWLTAARARGLAVSETLEFASMVQAGDGFQLASVKAVAAGYPLRGRLLVDGLARQGPPPSGQVWVEPRLLQVLGRRVGDHVQIGEARFRIAGRIEQEPDRSPGLFNASPRVLMALTDVPATGVVQPGSRLQYRLLLAGPASAYRAYRDWLRPRLGPGERWWDLERTRPDLARSLTRAQDFLTLGVLAVLLLTALASSQALAALVAEERPAYALLRSLGYTRRQLWRALAAQAGGLLLSAWLTGALLGAALAQALLWTLGQLLPSLPLVATLAAPLAWSAALLLLLFLAGALPHALSLARTPAAQVLRADAPAAPLARSFSLLLTLAGLLAVGLALGARPDLVAGFLGGLLLAGAALLLLCHGGLSLARRRARRRPLATYGKTVASTGRYWNAQQVFAAWRRLIRHPGPSSFALTLQALTLVVALVAVASGHDLLASFRAQIPPGAPNQFALNLAPDERAPFTAALAEAGIDASAFYPIVRGRLVAINGRPVQRAVSKEEEPSDEALNRELNLTWSASLPPGNRLLAGRWGGAEGVSLEAELAERLGIGLGDRLTFLLAGETLTVPVRSLRTVDWESFRPNFYLIFPPGALDRYDATWLGSFHLPPARRDLLRTLVQDFPTVVLLDVAALLDQAEALLDRVSQGLAGMLALLLLATLLVLTGSLAATRAARAEEAALLVVLGATRAEVARRWRQELWWLTGLGHLIGVLIALPVLILVYRQVFELDWQPSWLQAGVVLGSLLVTRALAGLPLGRG